VSERRRDVVESVLLRGETLTRERISEAVARLGEQATRELGATAAELRVTFDLRYTGQAFELSIDSLLVPDLAELREAFDRAHAERYGYADPDAALELITIRVAAILPGAEPPPATAEPAERRGTRSALFNGERLDAAVLGAGKAEVDGPAIFELPGSTLVVPPGWRARSDARGVVMER
jgi:N-methylhydantoinase A/oxoprolinase/acetone carboxylase beta subunit